MKLTHDPPSFLPAHPRMALGLPEPGSASKGGVSFHCPQGKGAADSNWVATVQKTGQSRHPSVPRASARQTGVQAGPQAAAPRAAHTTALHHHSARPYTQRQRLQE